MMWPFAKYLFAILSGDWFGCPRSDSYHNVLEWLIGIESELHYLVTTFVTSAILTADYFCLVSCISSEGRFSGVYLDCLVTGLWSLLDMLYCRVTPLDK